MADGNLRLEASANFSRLEQAVARAQAKIAKLERQLGQTGKAAANTGRQSDRAFSSIVARAGRVITAYAGVHQAVSQVNDALQDELRLREEGAKANQTFADALTELQVQTLGFTQAQREQLKVRAVEAGAAAGLTPTEAIQVAIPTISATLDADVQDRIDKSIGAMFGVGDILQQKLKDMPELPGAVMDLQRSMGRSVSLQEAAGFAATAASISRTTDIANLPNIIRSVAASVAILDVPDEDKKIVAQETLALFSALQAITSETVGARTATTMVNFIAELNKAAGREGGRTPEQLRTLVMQNEELLDAMKFKGKSEGRELQPQFLKARSDLATIAAGALTAIQQPDAGALADLKRAQLGEFDPILAANRAKKLEEARREQELLEKGFETVSAKTLLSRDELVRRGVMHGIFTRPARGFLLRHGDQDPQRLVQTARGHVLREIFGPKADTLAFRLRAADFTTEQLAGRAPLTGTAAFLGNRKAVQRAQQTLDDLLRTIEAKERQDAVRQQMEAEKRTQDNAKLTDNVGRAVNSAVQTQRRGSEQEN